MNIKFIKVPGKQFTATDGVSFINDSSATFLGKKLQKPK